MIKNYRTLFVSIITLGCFSLETVSLQRNDPDNTLRDAIINNKPDLAQLAISNGANVNFRRRGGTTPLISAAKKGRKRITHLLIENNADINLANNAGYTPLMAATSSGRLSIVKELVKAGADPSAKDKNNVTVIEHALMVYDRPRKEEIIQELLKNGAYPKTKGLLPKEKEIIKKNKYLYDDYILSVRKKMKIIDKKLPKQLRPPKDISRLTGEFLGIEDLPKQIKESKKHIKK